MIPDPWLRETLLRILDADTGVPAGSAELPVGDPRIAAAVADVLLPIVEAMGPDEVRRHPAGDVAVRFGPDRLDGLLIQTYAVSQHGDPGGGVHVGHDGIVTGRGASQNKGPMAAALAAVRARPGRLDRPVWLAVNTEGRSSHGGFARILDDLAVRAAGGVVAIGTDLAVSLGNRGRADVLVTATGRPHHSSRPGANPYEAAADAIVALRSLPLPPPHPGLGAASATPYRLTADPIAPHTVPGCVQVVVDVRLLPGHSPQDAVDAVRAHLAAAGVDAAVTAGPAMLPADVPPESPLVTALAAAARAVTGAPAAHMWSTNTFDAGYGCAHGVPTVMYGPGRRHFDAAITAPESVSLADCAIAAGVLSATISAFCS